VPYRSFSCFFLQENDLRKALIPFIGVSVFPLNSCHKKQENQSDIFIRSIKLKAEDRRPKEQQAGQRPKGFSFSLPAFAQAKSHFSLGFPGAALRPVAKATGRLLFMLLSAMKIILSGENIALYIVSFTEKGRSPRCWK
jgi:hypothetical protein